jgi:flagellar hook-associated protein 1
MGLFSLLSVGTRGLSASQLGMDIAGQNISNADVEGYSRKRLNMTADYRYDSVYGQMGFGVDVVTIERMRNTFIDQQIHRQNNEVGFYTELGQALEGIENIFTEPGETGLLHFVDQFFDSWQNLANNPADLSARTMVKTNAVILTDVFHNVANELYSLRQSRNDEVTNRIGKVNEIAQKIYDLNLEIGSVEVNNQNANDSRDQRDLLLKKLSELIDVTTTENEIGQLTVSSAGQILVSPVNVRRLELTTSSKKLLDGTTSSEIGVRFADSKREYTPLGGQVKGLLECRDKIIPEYQQKIDRLATNIVEKINAVHVNGYNLIGYSGISFFNQDVTGASDIEVSSSILSDVQNIAAAAGGEAHPGGQNLLPAGTHDFGSQPIQLYRDPLVASPAPARNILENTVIVSTPSVTLQEGVDYHIDHINGTLQMLHNGYDLEDLRVDFQYRTGGFGGQGDNATALQIAGLRSALTMTPDVVGNATSTFGDYYSSIIGTLGLQRNQSESSLETRSFLVAQYESHQETIAGVSLDEEMANVIKYQHTFQAAARLISIADKMLDSLLNM